jgi:predicted GIY-YIG superfamily endonuclease
MEITKTPHALYRFFGEGGELLYVGITNNPTRRFAQHGVKRDWWHEVATIRMERHESREAVLAAERSAILAERPRYNVVHNGGAPVTDEAPERNAPGDYPINAGEVVALGLSPSPAGDQECPVGVVVAVSPFGVRLALYRWHIEYFDGGERGIPWHRIMEVEFARRMDAYEVHKRNFGSVDIPADQIPELDVPVFDMDPLGDFQTIWTKGREYWREQKRSR